MVRILFRVIAVFILSFTVIACNSKEPEDDVVVKREQIKEIWYKGTVRYFDFEGGFYGIVTENGGKYLPLNLDSKYKKDGTILKFTGAKAEDMMSIQQWGTMFKLDKVELIKIVKGSKTKLM